MIQVSDSITTLTICLMGDKSMNDGAIQRGYSFKLIQEGAPESDLFPYKTHEAVKNTLFDLIEDSEKNFYL